ncbi:hypothetical protein Tco_0797191 [Tanacetum coccineum]
MTSNGRNINSGQYTTDPTVACALTSVFYSFPGNVSGVMAFSSDLFKELEFWVDKRTGGVCLSIGSKALSITGIDDQRYWNYILTNESRRLSVSSWDLLLVVQALAWEVYTKIRPAVVKSGSFKVFLGEHEELGVPPRWRFCG